MDFEWAPNGAPHRALIGPLLAGQCVCVCVCVCVCGWLAGWQAGWLAGWLAGWQPILMNSY